MNVLRPSWGSSLGIPYSCPEMPSSISGANKNLDSGLPKLENHHEPDISKAFRNYLLNGILF